MSQGLITGVANGSGTVTVNYPDFSLSTTVPVTVTSGGGGGGGVMSVKLYYTNATSGIEQDVSTYGGMLFFTGNSYTLVAKDQSGNVLSSGSGVWATTDLTNAPVSTSGVVTPSAGVSGGSISFTHTASNVTGSTLFSVLKTPGAIYKQMGIPLTTTALMAQISSGLSVDSTYNGGNPHPTGSGGSVIYSDGLRVNHMSIDSTTPGRQFMGKSGMVNAIPTTGGWAELRTFHNAFTRSWGLQVLRFDPPFSLNGTGGGDAAFKLGNWMDFSPSGRVGSEMSQGMGTSGQLVNYCSLSVGGDPEAVKRVGLLTNELTAGAVWASLILYESRGGTILSSRWAWFKIGTVPFTPFGGVTLEGPINGGASPVTTVAPKPIQYEPATVNFNQNPPTQNQYVTIFDWHLVNGDTYGDPYGILAATGVATPTLSGISGGTVARGATAASVVLTGTNLNANCQPLFSNAGVYPQSITINSSTQMTVVVAVGSGATPGAGTVTVNNQASQTTSGTQVVTVT